MADNPELTIIILNFNTKDLLVDCLNSINKYKDEISLEVIVSDNASSDGCVQAVKDKFPNIKVLAGDNVGFAKGNNRAKPFAKGKFILFLNPDTVLNKNVLKEIVKYLKNHNNIGALSCKLVLPSGKIDKDARRRFPTPWISFARLFLGNGRKYWYEDVNPNIIQEVDAIEGAFFLTRKEVLDKVGWFDEDYFFKGEDLDLCWKINKLGLKIVYYPNVFVYHLKGSSIKGTKNIKAQMASVDAMEMFYRKNLWDKYPFFISWFVILGIKTFKLLRIVKTKIY